ncbi:hypothetical protein [Pseudomonas citrulli]|uniref:Uncharacterized protein n=1 Tax=Pseudomonas citrulli TaxID=3064347 RepID=A0ABT9BW16_9PSED|nr:hypothetical protein [Pseudomonas sp. K18]MDO7896750.1 hypothetical protein [Pseudomonas sp. K18]
MTISTSRLQTPQIPPLSVHQNSTNPPDHQQEKFCKNKEIYHDVFNRITERYKSFSPETELGHQQTPGITADIEDISVKDIISILEYIKADDQQLDICKNSSAQAPFFNKFYLMSNPEQGWNLRLHAFNIRGNSLGEDDSPHYHRWVLASKILAGGYNNIRYLETPKTDSSLEDHTYSKYELASTKSQTSAQSRQATYLSEAVMTPIERTLYAQGDLKHFPKAIPHSVETHPAVMGTTMTLAHTSNALSDTSFTFKKSGGMESFPEVKVGSREAFSDMLSSQITHLQVMTLSEDLNSCLKAKFEANANLTPREALHLQDCKYPNYIETSLLPALAIYQMESLNDIEHIEFSKEASNIIDQALLDIDTDSLNKLIASNQGDLFDNLLTVEVHDTKLADELERRAALL